MTDYTRSITVVMTTFNQHQFTMASLFSYDRYYKLKVILADGGSEDWEMEKLKENIKRLSNLDVTIVSLPGGLTEECRNKASENIDTEFILFADNDAKVTSFKSIPILLDVMNNTNAVQSGAYALKLISREKKMAYVSTQFDGDYVEIDCSPAYFSLHRTKEFNEVGKFPLEWFYDVPKHFELESTHGGDLSISARYQKYGYKIFSPKETVPVLHWASTVRSREDSRVRPLEDWWYKNVKHIRCEPMTYKNLDIMEYNRRSLHER